METVKKKLLIVDDDTRNIFALAAVLKTRGYTCETAASATEGIEKMNTDKDVCVVLMDMMMPDMDGYEAIEMIRQTGSIKDIPIIAVTAQAMVGDKEKCLEAGANDYISKPIDVDRLMQVLEKY
jgi:two-component system, cell cycle response regulator DivK